MLRDDYEELAFIGYDELNPYPLGVPTRVMKEVEAIYKSMECERPVPTFVINTACLSVRDGFEANERVGAWLESLGVERGLLSRICAAVFTMLRDMPSDAASITIEHDPREGWRVTGRRHAAA